MSTSIYDGQYFKINRILCTGIGLWPYAKSRTVVRLSLGIFLLITSVPHIISVIVHFHNVDRAMLSALATIIMGAEASKLISLGIAENSMRELFENLQKSWETINEPSEKQILIDYAKLGKLITILYTLCMLCSGIAIFTMPLATAFLDIIIPLDHPRPVVYLLDGEYLVERADHFWPLFFSDAGATMSVASVTIAADSTYFVVSQQSCALYTIVVGRLRQLSARGSDISHDNPTGETDSYQWLVETVQFHRTALNFTNIVSDGYSMAFFFILVTSIISIPLSVCAMFAGAGGVLIVAFGVLLMCLMVHLFIIFYVGQRIITHGEKLADNVCNNEWYLTPLRTKKLLTIFMIRCLQPATLTAGGIMTIDFVTYSGILRSSASYITVLLSFR